MDQDVAWTELAVGVRVKLNLPLSSGVLDRDRCTGQAIEVSAKHRRGVEFSKLVVQRAHRLLLQDGDDGFNSGKFVGGQGHDEPVRRQRRVFQRLEVVPHVLENGVDEVARGALGRRRWLRAHGGWHGAILQKGNGPDTRSALPDPRKYDPARGKFGKTDGTVISRRSGRPG